VNFASPQLGRGGIEWISASLSAGRGLAEAVILLRALDKGSARLLSNCSDITTQDFAQGVSHLCPGIIDESSEELFDAIHGHCKDALLIVEDELRHSSDPVLKDFPRGEVATFENDVYHITKFECFESSSSLRKFIGKSSFGYPLNGFVICQMKLEVAIVSLKCGDFKKLASHCHFTFHSIFDGDAFVVWLPEES